MRRVGIQGLGVAGGFGTGVEALLRALEGAGPGPGERVVRGQALPAFLADDTPLTRFAPPKALRRMDHFSRLGLLGACLALEDVGLLGSDLSDLGVAVASGHGATGSTFALVDSIIEAGDPCASPTHFANSLHNAAAANIAIHLKATGPNLTLSQFGLSTASALLTAKQWLLEGRVERILFGAVDELSELVAYLHLRRHGLSGPVPGEGAAFFVLTAQENGRPPYGWLDEVAMGRDLPQGLDQEHLVLAAPGPAGLTRSCFQGCFGASPAAPALALAAAALMSRRGRTFPAEAPWTPGEVPLGAGRITALQVDEAGAYGSASIRPC